jgi:hypothetical protein
MARIEAALRGLATAAEEPSSPLARFVRATLQHSLEMPRAWTAITTERTRRQREQLAEEISRIQNETLRTQLRRTTSRLFMFLEDDLGQWLARGGTP